MVAYKLSPLAEGDLEDIWLYTVDCWSVAQADRYHADIMRGIEKLASGARRGRTAPVRNGYLKHAVGRHFVFFRRSESGVDIIRILHQSMDAERHLS